MSKRPPLASPLRYAGALKPQEALRGTPMNTMLIIGLSLLVLGMILRYAARKL